MANSYFKFKEFTVWHDRCAMKVGTDGVLLGAWAPIEAASSILDIGTGTGLVALMLAQRCVTASITAVEIDEQAACQARENIEASSWSQRIKVVNVDFKNWETDERFDLIVSNPPYFSDALKSPDTQRSLARHDHDLPFEQLLSRVVSLMKPAGMFVVILPSDVMELFIDLRADAGLFPEKTLNVSTKPGEAPKRKIVSFKMKPNETQQDNLVLEIARHHYSEEYISLTKPFYLKL